MGVQADATVFIGAQGTAMVMLHGHVVGLTSFPNGAWPTPNTTQYSTVKDNDADWSVKKD